MFIKQTIPIDLLGLSASDTHGLREAWAVTILPLDRETLLRWACGD